MDFYMKIERFRNRVSIGTGTVTYEASNLTDATRKAVEMLERDPKDLQREPPSAQHEERITVGPVLWFEEQGGG
jgi:hypothetical protein